MDTPENVMLYGQSLETPLSSFDYSYLFISPDAMAMIQNWDDEIMDSNFLGFSPPEISLESVYAGLGINYTPPLLSDFRVIADTEPKVEEEPKKIKFREFL
jgi:hypothetical protein